MSRLDDSAPQAAAAAQAVSAFYERHPYRPPADQYAAVELFRGTMVRHSVVAWRRDQVVFDASRQGRGDARRQPDGSER